MIPSDRLLRQVRLLLTALPVAAFVRYILLSRGASSLRFSDDILRDVAIVLFLAWWAAPSALYAVATRTLFGTALGSVIPIATALALRSLGGSGSSTAGVPLVFTPLVLISAAGVALAIDRIALGRARSGNTEQAPGQPSGDSD